MGAQTYRYKISYWILFLFAFVACEIMAVGTLNKNLPNLLAGNSYILDYVVVIIIVLICFPIGLFSLAVPFWAKIVLSPNGMFVWFSFKKPYVRLHVRPQAIKDHKDELEGYTTTKSIVNFPANQKIPAKMVKKLVKASIKYMKKEKG